MLKDQMNDMRYPKNKEVREQQKKVEDQFFTWLAKDQA